MSDNDPLRELFVATVPRGDTLPERGTYIGDAFVLVTPQGEQLYAWDGGRWLDNSAVHNIQEGKSQ